MNLHRLNDFGIGQFEAFIRNLTTTPNLSIPVALLTDATCIDSAFSGPDIKEMDFASRLEVASYLNSILATITDTDIERDIGLWAWLSLFYFNRLCPADEQGNRKPGNIVKWIPQISESRRYYRHLLLGPYLVFKAHQDNPNRVRALLSDPLKVSTSEIYRLMIENSSLVSCPAVVETTTLLYYDPTKNRIRRGAGSKKEGGGRRLLQVFQQLDCTFDLAALTAQDLMELLPNEFDKYREYFGKSNSSKEREKVAAA